ncbi:MAG: aspartate aminotransferase family protein [Thaumarchaeota archaeon]|nr:aspartate aminotransferase family protein [Nitrososphaerota archaeon]
MGRTHPWRGASSKEIFERAKQVFAGGVNHNARYFRPYPIAVARARGENIWDEDGNRYVDYWMGHMALLLGHSPEVVVRALRSQLPNGTHFGTSSRLSVELGEEIQETVPCAEMMRFCNTGAEATMYLVRLARAFTRKRVVVKITGGWHGYNTDLNVGVRPPFDRVEGKGILPEEQAHIRAARFNDLDSAERALKQARGDAAAIFLEPVLGAGGCIPAEKKYLSGLRDLADRSGCLLAFDEIITGYRVAFGGAQERYGVRPDLASLGKVVGGGLPIGVVCGSKDILSRADPSRKTGFVSIGGGTFSENPLTMTAGLATLRYLRKNRTRLYPRLEKFGSALRKGVDRAFSQAGVEAHTTGLGSLFMTHFGPLPANAEDSAKDDAGRGHDYAIGMIGSGVFLLPGHPGGISAAHKERDIDDFVTKSRNLALKWAGRRQNGKAKVTC